MLQMDVLDTLSPGTRLHGQYLDNNWEGRYKLSEYSELKIDNNFNIENAIIFFLRDQGLCNDLQIIGFDKVNSGVKSNK